MKFVFIKEVCYNKQQLKKKGGTICHTITQLIY